MKLYFRSNRRWVKHWHGGYRKIPCQDGQLYLRRLEFSTPWFGIYLHEFVRGDISSAAHDHPWDFVSILLSGAYEETVWPGPPFPETREVVYRRRRFSVARRKAEWAHFVSLPVYDEHTPKSAWTLLLRGPYRREWGFYVNNDPERWVFHRHFDRYTEDVRADAEVL